MESHLVGQLMIINKAENVNYVMLGFIFRLTEQKEVVEMTSSFLIFTIHHDRV
jgi:hypothetical protein